MHWHGTKFVTLWDRLVIKQRDYQLLLDWLYFLWVIVKTLKQRTINVGAHTTRPDPSLATV